MASYPSSVVALSTKNDGDTIFASHVDAVQDEIIAIENGLLTGIAHNLLPDANNTRDLGSVAKAWANVYAVSLKVNGITLQAPLVQTTTLTGTQNDFVLTTPANILVLRCNNATDLTFTGFVAGTDGQILIVESIGAGNVFVKHQNAGSAAANRAINFATVGDTPAAAGVGTFMFVYDGTTARWRLVSHEQGAWISFTPTLQGTGISYTTQSGAYLLRGRTVTVNGYILLSNKGTASGTVTGFPFASAAAPAFTAASIGQVNTLTTTWVSIGGYVAASATGISLIGRTAASTTVSAIVNGDLSNTTDCMFAVSYPVA